MELKETTTRRLDIFYYIGKSIDTPFMISKSIEASENGLNTFVAVVYYGERLYIGCKDVTRYRCIEDAQKDLDDIKKNKNTIRVVNKSLFSIEPTHLEDDDIHIYRGYTVVEVDPVDER